MSRYGNPWCLMEWVSNPYAQRERWRLRASLHECKDQGSYEDYFEIVKTAWRTSDMNILIWALIDSPEAYRQRIFQEIKEDSPATYAELVASISSLQKENKSAQGMAFQCVSVPEYLCTLPVSAQRCSFCRGNFPEGADIMWKPCKKHAWCLKCFESCSSRSLKPVYISCACIAPEALKYD